jgi:hypothetical protein
MGTICSTSSTEPPKSKSATERPERVREDSVDRDETPEPVAGGGAGSEVAHGKAETSEVDDDAAAESPDDLHHERLKDIFDKADTLERVVQLSDLAKKRKEAKRIMDEYAAEIATEDAAAIADTHEALAEKHIDGEEDVVTHHTGHDEEFQEMNMTMEQLRSLLGTPLSMDAGDISKAVKERRDEISDHDVVYPPLSAAKFAIEIVEINFADVHAAVAAKFGSSVAGDSSMRGSASVMTEDEAEASHVVSSRSLAKPRKNVSVKAHYLHSGKESVRKTENYASRPHDGDIIDIHEVLDFDLDIAKDEQAADHEVEDDIERAHDSRVEHVDGRIDLIVREKRTMKMSHIAFAEIKLDELLANGLLSRRGEWMHLNLVMYETSAAKFKSVKRLIAFKHGAKSEKVPTLRHEIGFISARCRLHWTPEAMREFAAAHAHMGAVERPLDKVTLMASRQAQLSVSVLGVLFDVKAIDEWQTMSALELTKTLAMETKVIDGTAEQMKDIVIVADYKTEGCEVVQRHSHKHSSRDKSVMFIGEKFKFDVLPFAFSGVEHMAASVHPQMLYRDDKVCEAPGVVLLKVLQQGDVWHPKPKEIGCCLLDVSLLFADVTLGTGKTTSDEFLFVEPLYETLYEVRWTRGLKEPEKFQCGVLFLKASFDWK